MSTPSTALPDTERLGFRELRRADTANVQAMFADEVAHKFYSSQAEHAGARSWIDRNRRRYLTVGFGVWALELRGTGDFVGDCGLLYQTIEDVREVEVAYHLSERHRGKGLATEAALACMEWGFANLDCARIVSMVHPENAGSHGVAARIHRQKSRFSRHGLPYDLYFTNRDDWEGRWSTT